MAGGACCAYSLRQAAPRSRALASACVYVLALGHAVSSAAFLMGAIVGNKHAVLMGPTGFRAYCGGMSAVWALTGVIFVRACLAWRRSICAASHTDPTVQPLVSE